MPLFNGTVIAQRPVATDYYEISFTWPDHAGRPAPGQFVTVRVADSAVPLLRRPFGVSAFQAGARADEASTASIIYWKRGPATRLMAGYEAGEPIRVMGPLGRGFPTPAPDARPVLVAGGVGIGPIWYLATELAKAGRSPVLIVGARTAAGLPDLPRHKGIELHTCTDDGSAGRHGTAIDSLAKVLDDDQGPAEIFLCGPHAMLHGGHEFAASRGVPAWVSLEQTMGCAVGACMGCAVQTVPQRRTPASPAVPADAGAQTPGPQYARVCTEGPVFRSTEVVW